MSADEINLSGIKLVPNAAETAAGGRVRKTTILIVVALFVLAALGGGYFYYRNVYQPKVYTRSLLPIYNRSGLIGSENASTPVTQVQNALNYTGAADSLAARAATMKSARTAIVALVPPRKLEALQTDLLEVIDLAVSASAEAEERARFFVELLTLKAEIGALHDIIESQEQRQTIRTVGNLRDAWMPHLRAAKSVGADAFSEKVSAWGKSDAQLGEVVTLWESVAPDLDFFIELLNAAKAATPLERFTATLTPAQNARGEKGFKNFEKFIELVDTLTTARSASALLDISSIGGASAIDLTEKAYALYREVEELKRRHIGL